MLMSGSGGVLSAYMRHRYLSELISGTNAKYVVLPETVAGRWGDATEYLWAGTTLDFLQNGRTYFVGADTEKVEGKKYHNVVQVRGANNMTVRQRFPVTYASWSPFGDEGIAANWFGESAGIVSVDNLKVGVLICFEPFIYLPPLVTMLSGPDVLVVCSNHWWCKDSYLPLVSDKVAGSWALLFDVPLVLAKNM
jgi:predicted amidohydrolase